MRSYCPSSRTTCLILLPTVISLTVILVFLSWNITDNGNITLVPKIIKKPLRSTISDKNIKNYCGKLNYKLGLTKTGEDFLNFLKPTWNCPEHLLVRTGKEKDGGKWTCGLSTLGKQRWLYNRSSNEPCLVYSFGVQRDSSFEAEVLETTLCSVYAYDPTVTSIATPIRTTNPRAHFKQLGLGGEDSGDKRTLATLMKENGHENRSMTILKMDIEGWEFPALNNILHVFPGRLPFSQLLVEVHIKSYSSQSDKRVQLVNIFEQFGNRGLCMYHFETNGCPKFEGCREFSFIDVNALDLYVEN